ncbi:MAG TPA: hypothetical protein V6C97_09655 [Oculatellaceae cyanobacterium]
MSKPDMSKLVTSGQVAEDFSPPTAKPKKKRTKTSGELLSLQENVELFCNEDGVAFASFEKFGHIETHPINSAQFRRELRAAYYKKAGSAISSNALKEAVDTLDAIAADSRDRRQTALRFAQDAENLYLDLCNDDWSVVRISKTGFQVIQGKDCPIRFVRRSGMKELPTPILSQAQGSTPPLELFRQQLNVEPTQWHLLILAVTACLAPEIPKPIIYLTGEQGSGKTILIGFLSRLIDPHKGELRSLPKEERELFVRANNSALLVFDNVSSIPNETSDLLCRLVTGAGFGARQLYSDSDEVLFCEKRPVWLNGIGSFASRPDFLERSVSIHLNSIPQEGRKTVAELESWFADSQAALLANLLIIASRTMRDLPSTQLSELPRMADFAKWGFAAAKHIQWDGQKFLNAFFTQKSEEQGQAIENQLATRLVASKKFWEGKSNEWSGTSTALLEALTSICPENQIRKLPVASNTLSGLLMRHAPGLRALGIHVSRAGGTKRHITLARVNPNDDVLTVNDDPPPRYRHPQNVHQLTLPEEDDDHDDLSPR